MKTTSLMLSILIAAAFLSGFPACTRHEVEIRSKEPIVIRVEAKVDIYNHAAEIEDVVSGKIPLENLEEGEGPGDGSWLKRLDFCSSAWAETGDTNEESAIRSRRRRFPRVADLKSRGLVGENHRGYLEARKRVSPDEAGTIAAENRDRQVIYRSVAAKQGAKLNEVEASFAQLHRDRAGSGDWIQASRGGKWVWVRK